MAVDVGTLVMKFESDDKKLMGSIDAIGKGMLGLGAVAGTAIIGIGAASLKTAADFEQGMDKVKAITDSTDEQMKQLEQSAKDLGASTSFSAKEAAEGMAFLGMAGFDTNEIIASMPGLLDLAAASGTDLALTADIVSDAMSAFKLEADQTGKFADILAQASARANVSVQTLGESFKYAAPIAGALGFSVEDVTAALGAMGNKGIKASQAGTTLRTAMTEMAIAAEENGSLFTDLGVELTNADGTMSDLSTIIYQLQDSFAGLSDAQKASTAESLFGKNAMTGMLSILDDSEGAFAGLVEELNNAEGASKKMADTMLDNLAGQMTLLKSATEGIAIEIGQVLIPVFVAFAKFVSDNMPLIKDFFVTTFESIVAAGTLVWDFVEKNLMPVFNMMFESTKEGLGSMQGTFDDVFSGIVKVAGDVWNFFEENLLPGFIKVFEWSKEFIPAMQEIFSRVFGIIVDVAKTLWTFYKDNILPIFMEVFDWVTSNMPLFQEIWEKVFNALINVITPVWEFIRDKLMPVFAALFKWVQDNMPLILSITKGAFDLIGAALDLVAVAVGAFFDVLNVLWDFMEPVFSTMGTLVGDAFTDILEAVNTLIDGFKSLIEWVTDAIQKVKDFFGEKAKGDMSTPNDRGSASTNTIGGNRISGNRANGGPIGAGESFVVGENGPEIFTPSGSGMVSAAGGGGSYIININGAQDVNAIMNQVVRFLNSQGVTSKGR